MLYKLRDIIINYDMNDFLKSGKQALERNDFAAAYAIAVILPDWCAADEYPDMKQVGKRYLKWCSEHSLCELDLKLDEAGQPSDQDKAEKLFESMYPDFDRMDSYEKDQAIDSFQGLISSPENSWFMYKMMRNILAHEGKLNGLIPEVYQFCNKVFNAAENYLKGKNNSEEK